MTIIVCPAASLADTCRRRRPSRVISLRSPAPDAPATDEAGSVVEHCLDLAFHDITAPETGLVAPDLGIVTAILTFAETWDGTAPFVISCFAGISRSTATAFLVACARDPDHSEAELASALRKASPCATPNALMVALADDLLGREGRMIAAIRAIGRGADYTPYSSFDYALRPASA